jgi:hypothetical protein
LMSAACASCGSPLDAEDVFCGNCGYSVKGPATQAYESPPAAPYGPASAAPHSPPSSSTPPLPPSQSQARANIPQEPGTYEVPAQWAVRNTEDRQRRGPAGADPASPRGPAASGAERAPARSAPPAASDVRMRVAAPEHQSPSEAAAAFPVSHITDDDWRMSYSDLGVSATLDPLSNVRFFWQLARRWVLYGVVTAVVDVVVFVLAGLLFLLGAGSGVLKIVPVISGLTVILLFFLFWLLPVPALLGQWSRLLSFQAPAAQTALDRIRDELDRHATPNEKLGLRPISPPGEGRRNYLELRRGYFAGYISCFPHGYDLYVGWTYWIHISPLRVILMRFGRKIQDYTGRGNDMYQTLRFEPARATIAAIHNCTLEGVEIAIGESNPATGRSVERQ